MSPKPRMSAAETTVIQVTNIAPSTSLEQMTSLFGYVGSVRDVRLYPKDDSSQQTSKVCFVRFSDTKSVDVAQHLTNTVFIDRALIVTPVADGKIPDEASALNMANSGLSGGSNSGVVSQVVTTGQSQVITTIDPRLTALGLPQYPPLPANMDPSKIEEIRRTVYIGNLDSSVSAEQLLKFFNQIGEVKYVRMAGDETQPTRFAFVEFTEQSSVANALQYNGVVLGGRPLKINHSNNAIVKPQTKNTEAAQKEIEEAMKRVREAQSLISAAIEPSYMKILELSENKIRSTSRSRSRSRVKERSRSRSRRRSRSITRRSPSREIRLWRERSREKRRSPRRSRSRERRKSTSRERRRRRRSYSREKESRESRRRRSRSRDRDRSSRKRRSRSSSRNRSKRGDDIDREREKRKTKEDSSKTSERSESEPKVEGPALPPETTLEEQNKPEEKELVEADKETERLTEGPSTPPPLPASSSPKSPVVTSLTTRVRSRSKSIERRPSRRSPSPVSRRRSRSRDRERSRRSRSRSYSRNDRQKRKREKERSRSREKYRDRRKRRRNKDSSGDRTKGSRVVRDYDEEEKGYDSNEEDNEKRNSSAANSKTIVSSKEKSPLRQISE